MKKRMLLVLVVGLWGLSWSLSAAEAAGLYSAVAWWKLDNISETDPNLMVMDAITDPMPLDGFGFTTPWPVWTTDGVPDTGSADGVALKCDKTAISAICDSCSDFFPDKLGFTQQLTAFVRVKSYDSNTQGTNCWILSRDKWGGGYVNSSWYIRYAKWGSYSFSLKGSDLVSYQVNTSVVGQWQTSELKWWNIFATFNNDLIPDHATISIYAFDMEGNLVGSNTLEVACDSINVADNARHTTLGGTGSSHYSIPYSDWRGEIEQSAVWNEVLTVQEMKDVILIEDPEFCGDAGTVYLPGDIDKDCYIRLSDFSRLTQQWLNCNDPANPNCD